MIDILPPKDTELEEKVLGSLLSSVEAAPVCIPLLKRESFSGHNQQIFEALRSDYDKHGGVDSNRVEHRLKTQSDDPESIPGLLLRLQSDWIDPTKTEEYAEMLNGLAAKRSWLRGVAKEAQSIDRRTPEELFTNTEDIIRGNLHSISIPGLTPSEIEERDKSRERGEQLYTGDVFMDKTFFGDSGSRRGQIIVPFADTSHGKTFWACWLVARYLEQGYKGVFLTFESTDSKIKDRIKNNLKDKSKIDNITIADVGQGMMNLDDAVSCIKYHNALMGVDFFVGDHTKIIPVPGLKDWQENERVTTCVNTFMRVAQETNSHGVVISQVNRETNRNARGWSKDPDLNNLYGSSSIEQNAEVAISIFRPQKVEELREYYPDGRLRAVRGPNYDKDSKTYDPNSVFIRQKKYREGEQYIPYCRFLHTENGLERVTENTPF